ncbi:MAG: RidA family protein [Marinisporobacter sp.]|jgi:enamine deaminase RidA (YjgF/YER057c/UK114 family)|nr:RidA family protein [Marinisporobacter sp.]
MEIEKRLEILKIKLPPCPEPAAVYVPAVLSEQFIFVAGQTPKNGKELLYKGKVGRDLSTEDGYEAAKICILRAISAIKYYVGDLDKIEGIVKLTGYVNCCEDFEKHSLVINGASELLEKIFGEKGKHARVAIGTNSLPGNAAVEIELIGKIKK